MVAYSLAIHSFYVLTNFLKKRTIYKNTQARSLVDRPPDARRRSLLDYASNNLFVYSKSYCFAMAMVIAASSRAHTSTTALGGAAGVGARPPAHPRPVLSCRSASSSE